MSDDPAPTIQRLIRERDQARAERSAADSVIQRFVVAFRGPSLAAHLYVSGRAAMTGGEWAAVNRARAALAQPVPDTGAEPQKVLRPLDHGRAHRTDTGHDMALLTRQRASCAECDFSVEQIESSPDTGAET